MGMIIVKIEQLPTRADNTSVHRGGECRVDTDRRPPYTHAANTGRPVRVFAPEPDGGGLDVAGIHAGFVTGVEAAKELGRGFIE